MSTISNVTISAFLALLASLGIDGGTPQLSAISGAGSGLVAHYTFDEGSGTTAGDSAGSNAGTLVGNPVWTSGKIGGALDFNTGANTYVDAGPVTAIKNAPAVSASMWVKFDTLLSGDETLLENYTNSTDLSIFISRYRNSVTCKIRTTASVTAAKTFTNDTGVWHLVTCVYDGSNITVYVDGVPGTPVAQTGNTMNASSNLIIGTNLSGSVGHNSLDDLRIYSRALSPSEITELYNYTGSGGGSTPTNGVCGVSNNVCTSGSLSDTSDTSTLYQWQCLGSGGGTTASCSLTIPSTPVNGVCGSSNNTCTGGTLSDQTDTSSSYLWQCTGTNGGSTASCSQTIPVTTYTLSITKSGSGSGTVTSTSINCGSTCSQSSISSGTSITLTATPASGSTFSGWSGGGCSGTGTCTTTVTANTTVTAGFNSSAQVSTTANSLTRKSGGVDFTWEINCGGRACRYGRFVNNEFWVVPIDDLGNNTGVVTITNILPAGVNHGAEVNPMITNKFGVMDIYPSIYLSSMNIMTQLPYSATPGQSIFKAYVVSAGCRQAPGCIASDDVLTVLSSVPENNGATVFRPPFHGTWKPLFTTDKVRMDRLPTLATISNKLKYSFSTMGPEIAARWTVPHMMLISSGAVGDSYRDVSPINVMSNYASNQAQLLLYDMMATFGTESIAAKTPAVYAIMQSGIDIYATLKMGAPLGTGAGQGLGRKPRMAYFSALYDDPAIVNEIRGVASNPYYLMKGFYQEDTQLQKTRVGNMVIWGDEDGDNKIASDFAYNEKKYWTAAMAEWILTIYGVDRRSYDGSTIDPYRYIDGPPRGPWPAWGAYNRDYLAVSSGPHIGYAYAQQLMPWLKYVNNDPEILVFADRLYAGRGVPGWTDGGRWFQPDACAPVDPREAVTCDVWEGTGCNYYKVTYGPDLANPGQCILDSDLSYYNSPSDFGCQAGKNCGRWEASYHGQFKGIDRLPTILEVTWNTLRDCADPASSTYRTGACSGLGVNGPDGNPPTVLGSTSIISPSTYMLSVSKPGTGQGVITGSSISCGSVCTQSNIAPGTSITLTAVPSTGSTFTGWSGGGCSGTGTCITTITSNVTVTATFAMIPDTTLPTVSISSPTGGTISGSVSLSLSYSL